MLKTQPCGLSHKEIGRIVLTSYHHNPDVVPTAKWTLSGDSLVDLTSPLPNFA